VSNSTLAIIAAVAGVYFFLTGNSTGTTTGGISGLFSGLLTKLKAVWSAITGGTPTPSPTPTPTPTPQPVSLEGDLVELTHMACRRPQARDQLLKAQQQLMANPTPPPTLRDVHEAPLTPGEALHAIRNLAETAAKAGGK
jgi:hypothetical protein